MAQFTKSLVVALHPLINFNDKEVKNRLFGDDNRKSDGLVQYKLLCAVAPHLRDQKLVSLFNRVVAVEQLTDPEKHQLLRYMCSSWFTGSLFTNKSKDGSKNGFFSYFTSNMDAEARESMYQKLLANSVDTYGPEDEVTTLQAELAKVNLDREKQLAMVNTMRKNINLPVAADWVHLEQLVAAEQADAEQRLVAAEQQADAEQQLVAEQQAEEQLVSTEPRSNKKHNR